MSMPVHAHASIPGKRIVSYARDGSGADTWCCVAAVARSGASEWPSVEASAKPPLAATGFEMSRRRLQEASFGVTAAAR